MARYTKKVGAATLRLEVNQASQNVTANTSVVSWSLHLDCTNGTSRHQDATIGWNVRMGSGEPPTPVRGTGYYGFDFRSSTTKLIGSGSTAFTHASDGRLTLNVSGFSADTGTTAIGYPGTVSGALTLTRIPKTAGAPRALTKGVETPSSVALSWTGPADDGGATITSYTVQYATNATFTQGVGTTTFKSTTGTVKNLTPGPKYYFRVQAINSRGAGSWSGPVTGSPALPAPTLTGWAQNATGGLVATWTPPSVTTGLTGYRLQTAHDDAFTKGVQNIDLGDVLTRTVTGLAGGRLHHARVAARTAGGTNVYSAPRSALLVLDAGDLDGWSRVGTKPAALSYYTAEGLRRGVTASAQALWVESLSTGAVTMATGTYGIQKTLTLTVGKTYRFEAAATRAGSPAARTYQLDVVGASAAPPVTVGTTPTDLGYIEFVAQAPTVTIRIMLAETLTLTAATDEVERVALHGIRVLELASDYGARLRETVYSSNLANHLDLACASVGASWYVGMDGITRFRLPGAALPTTAVFTDDATPGALHYVDVSAAYDTKSLTNRLEATNYGVDDERENEQNDTLIAADESSIDAFGIRTSKLDVNLWDEAPYDAALSDRLQQILTAHATPGLLITSIRWNAQENLEMVPQLDVGSRVLVRYRGTDQDSQITGIHHDIRPTRWITTITLDLIRT